MDTTTANSQPPIAQTTPPQPNLVRTVTLDILSSWPTYDMKAAILSALSISPFPIQAAASHHITGPRTIPTTLQVIGGERSGKSFWSAAEIASLIPFTELVYLAGAEYQNTQREFRYLLDFLRKLGILHGSPSLPLAGSWTMQCTPLPGRLCRIETISFAQKGSDALITTGEAPDLILIGEAGLCEHDHFVAAYSRVAERRGAVILSGTLKRAKPWYVSLFRELQSPANKWNGASYSFPSWQNTTIYPGGRNDPVIKAMEAIGGARFAERFGAEPVASPLLVFGREFDRKLHVSRQLYTPGIEMTLACDPGYAGAYALLVIQLNGRDDVRVIDEFYQQYATWDRAVAWLRARPYIKTRKDKKGRDIITNVTRCVMDVAGRQHHGDRSQVEQWFDATGIVWRGKKLDIEDGISRLRDFLRSPFAWERTRIHIDPRCEGLLWELGEGEQYQKDGEGNPVRDTPLDANNHARKALSYGLCEWFGKSEGGRVRAGEVGHDPYAAGRTPAVVDMAKRDDGRIGFVRSREREDKGLTWE